MKKQGLTLIIASSLFLLLSSVSAFAQEDRVKANIPFDFIVGQTTLPAGEYTISRGLPNEHDLLLIRNEDNRHAAFILANDTTTQVTPRESDLVFNKIGGEYFLAQLWMDGDNTGREIPEPRAERRLEIELARHHSSPTALSSQVRVSSE